MYSDKSDEPLNPSRRHFLKESVAVTAASLFGGATTVQSASLTTSKSTALRPNYLFFIVDEMRAQMPYESPSLQQFRAQYLTTQNILRSTGIEFKRHYTSSVACAPSRATLFTGQYPSLHGVTNTNGAAKTTSDPGMFWLDPNTVPTMGDWFRAAGYRTYWKGKWHISHADILIPGTRAGLPCYNDDGTRNLEKEAIYLKADRLKEYGFSGWIGPEPHGANALNSGSSVKEALGRDQGIAGQAIDLIKQLDNDLNDSPWLMVVAFVNPHDIALWGLISHLVNRFDFTIDEEVPDDLFTNIFWESFNENLDNKPSAQRSYRESYRNHFQPVMSPNYFRFYYQLHKNVDSELGRVYKALRQSRFFHNTVIIFTADHGDLLGSHGGLFQKWHTAYEESLRVPLIFSHPLITPHAIDFPTTHVDLLPTLLGLSGIEATSIRNQLAETHTEAHPLVGRDLTGILLGNTDPAIHMAEPIYFMTDDEISRGSDQENFLGVTYAAISQPNHIEAVIAEYEGKLWKYARYFDNPQSWSTPGTVGEGAKDTILDELIPENRTGEFIVSCKKVNKDTPVPEEFELYNLTDDPTELTNLYGNPTYATQQAHMMSLLEQQRALKRLKPQLGAIPDEPI